jgi:superfamily II DNA or RNA helicase
VRIRKGDYDEGQLEERVNKMSLVGDIIKTHQLRAKGRPTVVFAVSIAHSKHICEEFRKIGLRAVHVDCYTDRDSRKMINDQFKHGDIDVLSCVAIFEKGWDAPIASCLIQAAPTKSVMRYVQQVGRILRTHPDKDKAIILDHAGNTIRHGWVENIVPHKLDMGDKKENESVKKEKKKAEPTKCPKCGFVKETFACKACGYTPSVTQGVETIDGELEKKSKKPNATKEEKELWYSMFLGYAREKGKKDGWAYYKLRDKFGEGLTKTRHLQPKTPNEEVKKYIKYLNIKSAKGRVAAPKHIAEIRKILNAST